MIKRWIRQWLGVDDTHAYLNSLSNTISHQHKTTRDLLIVHSQALGRIIAKIDPMFVKPEIDDARRKESDAIGSQVIAKLLAEHKARDPYAG